MIQYFQYQIYVTRFFYNGDLQLFPGVDQLPNLEVPYPLTNGGQQLRHAIGRCPQQGPSVTFMNLLPALEFRTTLFLG